MDYLVRSGLVGDLDGAVEVVRSSVAGERYGNWTIDSFQRFITFNKLTEIKPGYPQGWPPAEDVLKLFPMEREFGRWVPEPGHLDNINRKINLEVVPA